MRRRSAAVRPGRFLRDLTRFCMKIFAAPKKNRKFSVRNSMQNATRTTGRVMPVLRRPCEDLFKCCGGRTSSGRANFCAISHNFRNSDENFLRLRKKSKIRDVRRASRLRACVTASPVAGGGRPAERGRVDAPSGRCVRRGRTAVKPPNPVDGPEHACGVLLGTRGEPSPKPRDPRQRPWGSTLCALRQGGQRLGRWCDGQRTKEQRGARTPAHAKVGGAMVLAGQACCRFSRFSVRNAFEKAPNRACNVVPPHGGRHRDP